MNEDVKQAIATITASNLAVQDELRTAFKVVLEAQDALAEIAGRIVPVDAGTSNIKTIAVNVRGSAMAWRQTVEHFVNPPPRPVMMPPPNPMTMPPVVGPIAFP